MRTFTTVPKAAIGDRVAILSPAYAASAVSEAIHEQAMQRLAEVTGLVPVEYPKARQLGASAEAQAADIAAVFADPSLRAVLATMGGGDQITVIPHIDIAIVVSNFKALLGSSDNTLGPSQDGRASEAPRAPVDRGGFDRACGLGAEPLAGYGSICYSARAAFNIFRSSGGSS